MYYLYQDYWNFYHKVTFDGPNKIIYVNDGITSIDVKTDIYSDWKEWVLGHDGVVTAKYLDAIRVIGGDPLPGARFVGATFFLINGWRIKPWEGNYVLTVTGNLYTEEGDDPFLPVLDTGSKVTITQTVSNLVDTIGVTTVTEATPTAEIVAGVWGAKLSELALSGQAGNAAEIVTLIKKLSSLIPAAV